MVWIYFKSQVFSLIQSLVFLYHLHNLSHTSWHLTYNNCWWIFKSFWDLNFSYNWLKFILNPKTKWRNVIFWDTSLNIVLLSFYIFSNLVITCFNIYECQVFIFVQWSKYHFVNMNINVQYRYICSSKWLHIRRKFCLILSWRKQVVNFVLARL